ncbi:sperm-associated antigen 5 [Gadus morhua]|uniref:sperm-associated antigen 5 n=1 Tax=Gadus morhua TaxID=8049 RepID=UPI0011B62209|nr:nuclear mitotic apparatus protein 1-like [Gadus morhua]
MSESSGVELKPLRPGVRAPLRSLENDLQQMQSTPSSKPHSRLPATVDVSDTTMDDPNQQGNKKSIRSFNLVDGCSILDASTACSGDITFKSFACMDGDIEILDYSDAAEDSIVLPTHQPSKSWIHRDLTISESIIINESESKHIDHAYVNQEEGNGVVMKHAVLEEQVDSLTELSNSIPSEASKNMNAQQEPTLVNGCREAECDITYKSFICDGGEVEILDATAHPLNMTIPLPKEELEYQHPGDEFIMSSVGEDSGDQDHTDHPYSSKECRFSCSIEQSPKLRDGPTDITLRSFVCTGGEVELSDTTTVAEQTIPVPSVQLGISNYLAKDESIINQSELAANQIIDPFKGHLEHCYFNNDFLNIPSPSSDLKAPQEPLSSSAEAPQLDEHDSVTDGGKSTGPFESLRDTAADVNSTDAFILLEKPLPLSEDPAEFSPTSYNDIRAVSIVESHDPDSQHKQPCALKRDESIEAAPANDAVITVANIQKLQDVSQTVLSPVEVIAAGYCSDFLAEISVLDRESLVEKMPYAVPLMGPLESPISRPLFNSTALRTRYLATPRVSRHREVPEQLPPARGSVVAASAGPASQELRGLPDPPLILDGFQKQRLRQVAEYLFLTSEKMPTGPAPFALAAIAPPAVKSHSICVGTSPVKWVDCCFNTSGQFVRKREISVADGCTATDPLLWNVPPGSLEGLPKQELEQRLRSHMINVEVLLQQLDASRGQKSTPAGPPPSQLRDVLVQTDHTELNQTSTYRDLYMTALGRIQELEMDQSSLQSLIQAVEETKITAGTLSADTDTAISTMRQMEQAVREDRCGLLAQYGQMKGLCGRFMDSQSRLAQKVRDALQEREDMRRQMDEALSHKEAAFSVTEQLRAHCAQQISEMKQSVGCHQELMEALKKTYPEQVALNHAYVETLSSASGLLSRTTKEQASLAEELARVHSLLKKTVPMLLKLNEKAVDALSDRNQHLLDRDQALEKMQQIQEALQQAHLDLEDADQQIGDLKIQATIMNSELGVLRQKLSEGEEERALLERKVSELSATISSTLASYTFLEQSLISESAMLQQSRKDQQQAVDQADQLEALLGPSEQRVGELSRALAHSEQQLGLLQAHCQAQAQQLQLLEDTCTQLSSAREMNEFLQMENEAVREQTVEIEELYQASLQGLRERNNQCEDLKGAVSRLQLEKASVEADLEATRSRASHAQQSLGEQLVQGVTSLTVQLHTLKGLTHSLHVALGEQNSEPGAEAASRATTPGPGRSTFIDRIMVALGAEKEKEKEKEKEEEEEEERDNQPEFEGLLSKTSAFTRITPAVTPKKIQRLEVEEEETELGSFGLPELLLELSSTVTELASTLATTRQRKDDQLEEMHSTICDLQREQQAAASKHRDEVVQLTNQLSRLSGQVEKGQLAQQHETQELRHMLQQSQVESWALRDELRKGGSGSDGTPHFMEQKIQLLQEVERLKGGLMQSEQARTKLLEKAKRHKMVYLKNEQKMEEELGMLDNMVETARKTLKSIPDVVQNYEELRKLQDLIS